MYQMNAIKKKVQAVYVAICLLLGDNRTGESMVMCLYFLVSVG